VNSLFRIRALNIFLVAAVGMSAACNYKIEKVESATRRPGDQGAGGAMLLNYDSLKSAIFSRKCVACHAPGGNGFWAFDVTSYRGVMVDVTPGKPDESELFKQVFDGKMPKGSPLPPEEVELIRQWILIGAPR
jgi:hypothetical protein